MVRAEQLTYGGRGLGGRRRHVGGGAGAGTGAGAGAGAAAAAVVGVVGVVVAAAAVVVYGKKLEANSFAEIYINKQTTGESRAARSVKDIHSHCPRRRNAAPAYTVTEQLRLQARNTN